MISESIGPTTKIEDHETFAWNLIRFNECARKNNEISGRDSTIF